MQKAKQTISVWLLVGMFNIWLGILFLGVSVYRDNFGTPLEDVPDDTVYQVVSINTSTPFPTAVQTAVPTSAPNMNTVANLGKATATDVPLPLPSPTSTPSYIWKPTRIVIPAIELDAPVVAAKEITVKQNGTLYKQLSAPDLEAAGWVTTTASIGLGNTVFIGHSNGTSRIFAYLQDLRQGDIIEIYSGHQTFYYGVEIVMILPERWQSLAVRLKNASWLEATDDNRITLVTCWPFFSNTHRLILVAKPISPDIAEESVIIPRVTPLPILPP